VQRTTASLLTLALFAAFLAGTASAQVIVAAQINNLPLGANIEVRLKNKRTLRGTRGPVSDVGFTLLDAEAGARQLSFDEVTTVKPVSNKSQGGRHVLRGVTIGLAVLGGLFLVAIIAHPNN
jgi:hypothetical protein